MTPNRVIAGSCALSSSERLAIALEQPIEKQPPARVAERPERRRLGSSIPPDI